MKKAIFLIKDVRSMLFISILRNSGIVEIIARQLGHDTAKFPVLHALPVRPTDLLFDFTSSYQNSDEIGRLTQFCRTDIQVEFAELCAKVERYVGMEGGGMDQAIEVLADEGCALKIDFNPLRFRPVYLPRGALFAVVHCGITHNKAAGSLYNERVVECRLAAQVGKSSAFRLMVKNQVGFFYCARVRTAHCEISAVFFRWQIP